MYLTLKGKNTTSNYSLYPDDKLQLSENHLDSLSKGLHCGHFGHLSVEDTGGRVQGVQLQAKQSNHTLDNTTFITYVT